MVNCHSKVVKRQTIISKICIRKMADSEESVELLFFDTFSHDINEELNLDLVQFPEPVYITEVRIIPLGARVQADFPGGVRLGATNPSKFHIELFVNDLAKPGASTFERLGDFEYNQNDCINLQCANGSNSNLRQIPTDGLVIRGCYTTITLAIYGSLAKDEISEQQISSPTPPIVPVENISGTIIADDKIETKAIEFTDKIVIDTKDNGNNLFEKETPIVIVPPTVANISVSDSARKYTEEWIASTGSELANAVKTGEIVAKSPDIDHWDADDDLNKSVTILSPKSARRSRSPDSRRLKREWSKSPEYRRHRSYERGVLDKKLSKTREYESCRRTPPPPINRAPRTPSSEDIQSLSDVRRPHTPESHISDDKYLKLAQSPQSVTEEADVGNVATVICSLEPIEPDDDAISQDEQFEPILSDDEIPDDVIDQYDMDYEDNELITVDSALKQFNPFTEEVKRYLPMDEKMSANARELIELATKCLHRSKLKESSNIEKLFAESQSNEMRENWVHAAEQLIQIINLIYNLAGATQLRSQQALNSLIVLNRQQLVDWMRIGLNFECANSQQQPGYKIRHMKCGLRLIELLAVDETFIEYLINREKFNIFEYLYRLYEQKFMALSLKLMICRAIYACLDTKSGIDFFTQSIFENDIKPPINENGYQKLITLIQANPLTRIKFALKSILKKVNLYESMQAIRNIVSKKIQQNNDDIKMEHSYDQNDQMYNEKVLQNCLRDVLSAFTWDAQSYWQPKRFLPISTKFEKVSDSNASRLAAISVIRLFKMTGILESVLLIVSQAPNNDLVSDEVFDLTLLLLESFCRCECGLNYLYEKIDVTNVLIKCLIQAPLDMMAQPLSMDDVEMSGNDTMEPNIILDDAAIIIDEDSRRYQLGIEMAYKLKAKFCLDAIMDVPINHENRENLLVEHFHTLYSLAVADNYIGRNYVIETITMNSYVITILKQIENEKKNVKNNSTPAANAVNNSANDVENFVYKKPPILNYAVDLIDMIVRFAPTNLDYLKQHGSNLLNLVKSFDQFDDAGISQTLQETAVYLKPLQLPNIFSYDNIIPLYDIIKRNLEFITTFPGDLITALRIIRHLAIPDTSTFDSGTDFATTFGDASETNKFKLSQEQHQVELKYKCVILQLYSADGCSTYVQILEKLTAYFTQPAVHVATLGSNQGQLLLQILLPTIQILRKMLTYVIECRNTDYKDLTTIEPLLKTYTLVSYVPGQSMNANDAQKIQNEIINTLMAYTQPTPIEGVDTESVHKSLWTQMIGELCKYILNGPYTILPGLTILSQLLPVPLPILTRHPLTLNEQNRLITERQLWSAHLHPQSNEISDLIQALCVSSYPPLLDLLSRTLGQMSDLAPNMALLVTKTVAELLLNDGSTSIQASIVQNGSTIPQNNTKMSVQSPTTTSTNVINSIQSQLPPISNYVNPLTKRILGFLSNILCYPAIKAAFHSIMQGKIFEQMVKILSVKSGTVPSNLLTILIQEQEFVMMIFHTILNVDISLVGHYDVGVQYRTCPSSDLVFGCSIPPKDCVIGIVTSLLDWFLTDDSNNTNNCHLALKTMALLSNYDYTTYQMKVLLDKRKDQLQCKLRTLTQLTEDDHIAYEITLAFLLFLLSLIRSDGVKNERQYWWTESDLVRILQFKRNTNEMDVTNEQNIHALLLLEQNLQNFQLKEDLGTFTKSQLDELAFALKKILKALDIGLQMTNSNKDVYHADSPANEPPFPSSENIVVQYSMRPIFNIASNDLKSNEFPEQFSTNYWYSHLQSFNRFDNLMDTQSPLMDNVPCDFVEMIKICLPTETNLTNDCKRLLHLSASPQSNRERTTTAPCFRTRRVEVEPTTGRPEKKLYISRGRGFPRPVQSRADLFRSRPPNTSRPPSLHVDDFLALETCGAQPTGPTGYNKLSREIINIRGTRGRGRGRLLTSNAIGSAYRHSSLRRTNSPSTWGNHTIVNNSQHDGPGSATSGHFRTATAEPVTSHFQSDYFNSGRGSRRGSLRPPRSFNKFN